MTNAEFSNEFDVLYNSITSDQAPGLDEYEKSVFLTKAQDEIIKRYFNPRSNKTQEGFDGNEKRQIDFSMLIELKHYKSRTVTIKTYTDPSGLPSSPMDKPFIKDLDKKDIPIPLTDYTLTTMLWKEELPTGTVWYINSPVSTFSSYIDRKKCSSVEVIDSEGSVNDRIVVSLGFLPPCFDCHDNTKTVTLEGDILMFINEYVLVDRRGSQVRLNVLPINYNEYSRLMSKPYKRPLKNQAWRLLDNSDGLRKSELIVGPIDSIKEYVTRYVKRPRAIILDVLPEETSLDGYVGADEDGNPVADPLKAVQGISCELDPILHAEILQRGVELAKAAYTGDLQSQLALGQVSQTDVGTIQASR